jgi:hypothetical protein
MIQGLAARWLLTAVFTVAALRVGVPLRERADSARPENRVSVVFCGVMCAALIAMAWWSEPTAATWLQAALFACAVVWFGRASVAAPTRATRLRAAFDMLMAGAMIWMLTAMPAITGMSSRGSGTGTMASMSRPGTPASVLAVSLPLAVSCAAASVPWLARAIRPGRQVKDPTAASQAAMSAGMAAMLFATL